MALVHLDWAYDSAGYRIEERQPAKRASGRHRFLTKATEGLHLVRNGGKLIETTPLKTVGLYRRLAEIAESPEGALSFITNRGFLHRHDAKAEPIWRFFQAREDIRWLLQSAKQNEWSVIADTLRSAGQGGHFESGGVGRLGIVFDWQSGMERPTVRFRPGSLEAAIYVQALMDFCEGTELRNCRRPGCDEWFTFGPGTGHRETRQYCNAKCRSAHRHLIKKGSFS